jgi:hypothetical protein
MHQTTQLASGSINGHDRLTVELVEPPDLPAAVLVRWPTKPSVCTPDAYSNVAAACMQVLSAAVVELAAIRTRRSFNAAGKQQEAPGKSLGLPFSHAEQASCRTSRTLGFLCSEDDRSRRENQHTQNQKREAPIDQHHRRIITVNVELVQLLTWGDPNEVGH